MIKSISLILEDTGLQIEHDTNSDLVSIRLNEYVLDLEETTPGNEVYIENDFVKVYPTVDEVKEIIKALQSILPEEEIE
jgi:hypothetical protein